MINKEFKQSGDFLNRNVRSFQFSFLTKMLPPENFRELMLVNFGQTLFRVRMCSQFPSLSQILPGNGIHCAVDLLIGRDVINDFDSLQVLVKFDFIANDVVFA